MALITAIITEITREGMELTVAVAKTMEMMVSRADSTVDLDREVSVETEMDKDRVDLEDKDKVDSVDKGNSAGKTDKTAKTDLEDKGKADSVDKADKMDKMADSEDKNMTLCQTGTCSSTRRSLSV
ncbi:unnamed protein product, partial [Mesorhabditis belari]|uniref:Uncharacterized protein n=1 Tax=Mesorhabditis belari TaxID=2138241 RepID=A0AAF3J4K8_9BILA